MNTHTIGFYEDLTKIIFKLSSNIIKYAPYLLYCMAHLFYFTAGTMQELNLGIKAGYVPQLTGPMGAVVSNG